MNIRSKIYAIVGLMGLVSILIGGMAIFVVTEYSTKLARLESVADRVHKGEQLNRLVTAVVMDARGIYASNTVEAATPFAEGVMKSLDKIDALLVAWRPLVDAADIPAFDKVVARTAEFRAFRAETARLGRDVDPAQANAQGNNADNRANRKAYQAEIDAVVVSDQAVLDQISADIAGFQTTMLALIAGTIVVGLIGGIVIAGHVGTSQLSRPIGRLTETMQALAEDNLEVEVPFVGRKDELGRMAGTLQVFKENATMVRSMGEEGKERAAKAADRAKVMDKFQSEFASAVAAALEGNFSERISENYPDNDIVRIAEDFNALLANVDDGLAEAGVVLAALAQTDLTLRMNGDYKGAFEKLKHDTNGMADRLVEIVGQLKQTSRGVKTATGEILSGANDLSERTTKQAATIEETSAAMEQLAHTVMDNAKKAGAASEQAKVASRTAEEGGEVMEQANHAMERISASSSKISNIIGMIDDIAFQTNLLALNASVEAARAGEAGKGFAVVAVEVRRLAQSAAEASSEVKVLIEQSGEEVAGGTKLVASAAEKLSAILDAVRANASEMEAIANDSREQASSIDEVNVAVRQMDEMTQHNAALVEETNAAIEQTESQASELDRIVEVFTLSDTGPSAASGKGAKDLQRKVVSAAKSYLSKGNTAVKADTDWSEF